MKTPLLASLLLLPVVAGLAPQVQAQGDPAGWVKSAIERDWVARVDPNSASVVVTSPSYAMPFDQGCVIHRLFFPSGDGRPSLGNMVAQDLYFVFASGDACASAEPGQFFGIEPGNDLFSLLDFARRLKNGPKLGRDRVLDGALAKVSQCFAPEAMATTRIVRAHSWREQGSRRDQYQVTLLCEALEDQGDVVAIGARGQDAITWQVATLDQVVIDQPVRRVKPAASER
jgi:hypothetical protein